MVKNSSIDDDNLIKVIRVDVLTAKPNITADEQKKLDFLPEMPLLSFELENGSNFLMSSIPRNIAIEIAQILSGLEEVDSRLSIAELLAEISIIKRIVIDAIVPYSNAYQASIELKLEGVDEIQHFQMIPSHSVLLALISDAPIYVSKLLLAPRQE